MRIPSARGSWPNGFATSAACSSCRATTSTWTAASASVSGRTPSTSRPRSPSSVNSWRPSDRRRLPPAIRVTPMRVDLALVGFGNVGRRFARLIEERRDWLALDYDVESRIVGIATRHHGAVFRDAGLDAVGLAVQMEAGHPIVDAGTEAADSFDVIRRLAESAAPFKVGFETPNVEI